MHAAARALFAAFPVAFGVLSLARTRETATYLEGRGIAGALPVTLAVGSMLLAGGLMVLLGWHRFIGAGLLFLVLLPGAFALYPFWQAADPATRRTEAAQFLMTLGLAGASLFVAFYSSQPWPLSLGN
jgi:uncharacterized membrane protein YphA (DoxX/SURF4 family)